MNDAVINETSTWSSRKIAGSLCNPNLLDNWYFLNPVNQRGEKTWSSAGIHIDRWMAEGSGSISPDGVAVTSKIYQTVDNSVIARLLGKTVSMSGLTGSGELIHGILNFPDKMPTEFTVVKSTANAFEAVMDPGYNTNQIFRIRGNGVGKTFAALKAELGSAQTLAHEENGKWVLNELPDYGEQLLHCQQFFQVFEDQTKRPVNCLDFRPAMRDPGSGKPALGTIAVSGKTLYTASAEL